MVTTRPVRTSIVSQKQAAKELLQRSRDSAVATVDPDILVARELAFDRLQELPDARSILEIGGMGHHLEQQAQRIDRAVDVCVPTVFRPVIAMRSTSFRRFDRLAIDHGGTRGYLVFPLHVQSLPEGLYDALPDSGVANHAEGMVDR